MFNTVADAVSEAGADTSILFVPPAFAADAILEAADAGIKVIICITEGIPVADMVKVKAHLDHMEGCTLVGPNCPGVMTAGEAKVGIMPGFIFNPGRIGIVSKSGTLTYEAVDQITKAGLGQSTAIGIGGDPIIGTTTLEAVQLLMADSDTDGIIMIGEIGGDFGGQSGPLDCGEWNQASGGVSLPVLQRPKDAPWDTQVPIVSGEEESAEAKKAVMRDCGIHVVDSPAQIGSMMVEALKTVNA